MGKRARAQRFKHSVRGEVVRTLAVGTMVMLLKLYVLLGVAMAGGRTYDLAASSPRRREQALWRDCKRQRGDTEETQQGRGRPHEVVGRKERGHVLISCDVYNSV